MLDALISLVHGKPKDSGDGDPRSQAEQTLRR